MRSFISLFLALAGLVFASGVFAAPLHSRQIGNIQCNVARLRIVGALATTTNRVKKLNSASAADDSTTSAASDALDGLDSAADGIKTIALALVSGQTAPADARDQVGTGLTKAKTALDSITSDDSAVTSQVSKAQSSLDKAISAGQDVVSECK